MTTDENNADLRRDLWTIDMYIFVSPFVCYCQCKGLFIIYWEYGTGVLWERPMENVLVPSTKISKKVGVLSVEGRKKVHVPYNYTILTLHWRHNMHCHLHLGASGAVSPPVGPGQGPGGGPGGKAKVLCLLFQERNYAH